MMITKGLPDYYTAVQMHLHWGGWDLEASGAEHTLDGIRYMAEVRLFVKERETTYVVHCLLWDNIHDVPVISLFSATSVIWLHIKVRCDGMLWNEPVKGMCEGRHSVN